MGDSSRSDCIQYHFSNIHRGVSRYHHWSLVYSFCYDCDDIQEVVMGRMFNHQIISDALSIATTKTERPLSKMNSEKFGPYLWHTMFIIAMNYPVKVDLTKKEDHRLAMKYKKYFYSYKSMLPCGHCRESYSAFLRVFPIDNYLGSRRDLVYWLYLIHDLVNKKLYLQKQEAQGKVGNENAVTSPPFSKVYSYYESFRAKK